ncbi:hypothetical protein COCC4DRAFT_207492 [Bipolaris maydis ATCC 48331]|uniref:N-acetyltransferase domain-containing protein n=2 Tax=Cochliobolus heterostrophus TaxID=5016 RepID=M2UNG7_COCH5|nr:uncharacterized protein COCC4DRAFT_207492 [Bipolaris maydis ATCC 48331]EMD89488.1 hypothetical protein COCHEDRAFT_1181170 [Bipolaris maydis C5]KAH7552807.1 hypothetical protein BM1_08758 [Bipolaris maydis]ENH99743.1 hypothetical protein COCC4DRAFT_207492 [Bipolaris maydis ATCC 48331]KAJ5025105.1 acyl-CoA N-acyltransferase [Bipolaris maydis]KAJ5057335.1 acyl-CoA N-acyltransferase [Bipolaris maydis]
MPDPNFHITTPRLYLSYGDPSNEAHIDFSLELITSAPALRSQGPAGSSAADREAARKRIADTMLSLKNKGFGRYFVWLRPENDDNTTSPFSSRTLEPIGSVGLQLARLDGVKAPSIPDVGFIFLEKHQGKGYATEAVRALMKYYEEEKGIHVFSGFTKEDNEGARGLFRRLGFRNHGVRMVSGIMWNGEDIEADTWTWGVEEGHGLEEFGI